MDWYNEMKSKLPNTDLENFLSIEFKEIIIQEIPIDSDGKEVGVLPIHKYKKRHDDNGVALELLQIIQSDYFYGNYTDESGNVLKGAKWCDKQQGYFLDGLRLATKTYEIEVNKKRIATSNEDFRSILRREYNKYSTDDFKTILDCIKDDLECKFNNFNSQYSNSHVRKAYTDFKEWLNTTTLDDLENENVINRCENEVFTPTLIRAIIAYNTSFRVFDKISMQDMYNIMNNQPTDKRINVSTNCKGYYYSLLYCLSNLLNIDNNRNEYILNILSKSLYDGCSLIDWVSYTNKRMGGTKSEKDRLESIFAYFSLYTLKS